MSRHAITSTRAVREAFWRMMGGKPRRYAGKDQNALPCDVRCAFVGFVDLLAREGTITERLAASVTL